MKKILSDLIDSFRMNEVGFSSRKLTAFVIVILVMVIHIKWIMAGNFSDIEMVLTIDYAFISALFGMTTFQNVKSSKKEDENKNE
jgi:hypothetical protein